MSIKQVTCKVCQKTVNKAQTYHTGNGDRACKNHEGVVEKRDQLQADLAKKAEDAKKPKRLNLEPMWNSNPAIPKCWVCMNEGIRQDAFFQRVLIEREKAAKIYGVVNPFDTAHPGNQLNIGRCIFVLTKSKAEPILKFVREDFQMLIDMSGAVAVCGPCCHNFKIDPFPKVDLDQLTTMAAIYEVVAKPVVQAVAVKEMTENN